MNLTKKASFISGCWDRLVSSLGLISGLLIVAISALSTWNITSRYIARSPLVWADEICEYMLLISEFLTLPRSWHYDLHVCVDILYSRWSKKWRSRANLVFSFWALIFCAGLTWYGFLQARYAIVQGETSITSSSIATYPVLAFIPIGAFLLCIQIVRSSWRLARENKDGAESDNETSGQPERENR